MIYQNRSLSFGLPLVIIACGLLPGAAPAAEPPTSGPMTFEAFDVDGNGVITEQEFYAARADRMAARAAQGAPMRGAANAPAFSFFDRNGDGKVTPEEFSEARQTRMQGRPGMGGGMGANMQTFTAFDLNTDGVVTKAEFNEARAKRIAKRSQQGYPMRNLPNAPTFEDIDTNSDGLITPDEFAAHQMQHRRQMMQP
jgi:Ca2+-binding EF-hand superfamily protein